MLVIAGALATTSLLGCGDSSKPSAAEKQLHSEIKSLPPSERARINRHTNRQVHRFKRHANVGLNSEPDACIDFSTRVNRYRTVRPGNSRREYLILLHTLQATCPYEARQSGLTADFLKPCTQLAEEGCSAYHDPRVETPQIPR